MKKLVFIVLLTFVLSSCSLPWQKGGDVESMTLLVQSDYYFTLTPDYGVRLLEVKFDGDEKGTIGGDYFDRFEDVSNLVVKEFDQGRGVVAASDDQRISFEIHLLGRDDVVFSDFQPAEMIDYEEVESFYVDIADLFEREIY
ncbi:hypothetical protein HN709_04260 [Candidatus Peregrinibacteria bacterium]|jgi:hypothetical protein|nr:hypothetical protein [Candidatus Peregrinibacteria bacterium]MBT7736877.1 hypothetical protein [Candidatus Peregrinibacteria bacterium]